ncbi:MAG: aminomethyl transferase family protein [Planctomycetes bacterium]|nr:aminomethyl transferase family protein [Planctomycetota bacterium]
MATNTSPLSDFFAQHGADFIDVYGINVPLRCGNPGLEYQAALEATLICDGAHRAWITVKGSDVCDFFQRILSSDLHKLEIGGHQLSAMLDGKGRWIAELILYRFKDSKNGEWNIGVDLPLACRDAFMQKSEMMLFGEDVVFQPQNVARIKVLGAMPAIKHNAIEITRPDAGADCTELLFSEHSDAIKTISRMHADGIQLGGWVAQDILRVESGFPLWGSDFDTNYTLPATNEWRRASITKGCYAGQEVVARINTYGEAPRQLVQLQFSGDPQFMQGATVFDSEDKEVGKVSSWVFSPQRDMPIAFAYLKRSAAKSGTLLRAKLQQHSAPCLVVASEKVFG